MFVSKDGNTICDETKPAKERIKKNICQHINDERCRRNQVTTTNYWKIHNKKK